MCGLYSLTTNPEAIRRLFRVQGAMPNWPARYKVSPTETVPIISLEAGERIFAAARWGLVPSWSRDKGTRPLINARAETVATAAPFRAAFKARRCLVPADAFFEWTAAVEPKGPKQPHLIARQDRAPFAMAGLFEHWQAPDGSPLVSTTIVTCPANSTVARLHNRMPVILGASDTGRWLDPQLPLAEAQALLVPAADDLLITFPVQPGIHRRQAEDPTIVAPLDAQASPSRPPTDERQLKLL